MLRLAYILFKLTCVVLALILMMCVLPGFSYPVSMRAAFPQEKWLRVASFTCAMLCNLVVAFFPSPRSFSRADCQPLV